MLGARGDLMARKVEETAELAPQWVLSAENRFDILVMVWMVGMAEGLAARGELSMPAERLCAMREKLREFEMYEEKFHR